MTAAALVAALVAAAPGARADSDFQLWTEAGVSRTLARRWRLGFEQHVRLRHDATLIDRLMPEAHLTWQARKKRFALRLGYRYLATPWQAPDGTHVDQWHRVYLEGSARLKLARGLRLRGRLRLQEQLGAAYVGDGETGIRHAAREKLELSYAITPALHVAASGELFLGLADPDGLPRKVRGELALAREFGDHELAVSYLIEERLDDSSDPRAHVLGLAYRYSP